MADPIVSGIVLAIISGLTFVAYKHPAGYRRIISLFAPGLCILFVMLIMTYSIDIAVSIRSMAATAAETQTNIITVSGERIKSLNLVLTKLTWLLAISGAVSLYLVFLFGLPYILDRSNTSKGNKEERSRVDESSEAES